jgi:DNA-binding MarR family transcriptional regulator
MSEIGRHMEISKPYMTTLVDKLILEGLVERVTDPDDRRAVEIRVTPAGKRVIREFTRTVREAVIKRLSSLNSEEVTSLHDSMRNARSIISRLDKKRGPSEDRS